MPITASCGCLLKDGEDTVPVRLKDWSCDAVEGFQKAIRYGEYCPTCAEKAKTWDEYIPEGADEREWFDSP